MARSGLSAREISQVAVKNHANAVRNPYAHFRAPVALAAVMASRLVADPSASSLLPNLRRGRRARADGQPRGRADRRNRAGTDALAVRHRQELTSFRRPRPPPRRRFAMAGFGADRVEVAEVHDAFTPFELIALEDPVSSRRAPPGAPRSTARPRSTAGYR